MSDSGNGNSGEQKASEKHKYIVLVDGEFCGMHGFATEAEGRAFGDGVVTGVNLCGGLSVDMLARDDRGTLGKQTDAMIDLHQPGPEARERSAKKRTDSAAGKSESEPGESEEPAT